MSVTDVLRKVAGQTGLVTLARRPLCDRCITFRAWKSEQYSLLGHLEDLRLNKGCSSYAYGLGYSGVA